MFDLQTVLTYLTLISIPVGVAYHILILNNTLKNQRLQLETRQVQLFQQFLNKLTSPELITIWEEIQEWRWETPEEFMQKYGPVKAPAEWYKFRKLFGIYENMGILLKEGIFEIEMLYDMAGGALIRLWEKFEDVLDYYRVNYEEGVKGMLFEYCEDLVYALKEVQALDKANFAERYERRKQTRAKYGKTIPEYNP